MNNLPAYNNLSKYWSLDESIVYLNHGSFGATPNLVLEKQKAIQAEMEAEAITFFVDKLPSYINDSKKALGQFVGTSADNLVFTPNTTTGVNTIFNSLPAKAGDEWLITNHNYGACINAAKHYAKKYDCKINVAQIPYPLQTDQEIIDGIAAAITPNTTVALIDYITSASAVVFPIKEIIDLLHSHNIEIIVDAAHAPGMVEFNVDDLKADYFIANCHKWICSPKGSAFIYVAPEHQANINPLVISHYNDTAEGTAAHWSNQFLFDGTHDYSAYICVKDAIDAMPIIAEKNWTGIKKDNQNKLWTAANKIANALDVALPIPQHMAGTICNIPMPEGVLEKYRYMGKSSLKTLIFDKYKIEVPFMFFPAPPTQWLRISAQLYNSEAQYDYLIESVKEVLHK